jgi:ATP-dependent DNA helicase RecQ
MEAETDDIKEAIDAFEGDFEEEDIRLYRLKFISEIAN